MLVLWFELCSFGNSVPELYVPYFLKLPHRLGRFHLVGTISGRGKNPRYDTGNFSEAWIWKVCLIPNMLHCVSWHLYCTKSLYSILWAHPTHSKSSRKHTLITCNATTAWTPCFWRIRIGQVAFGTMDEGGTIGRNGGNREAMGCKQNLEPHRIGFRYLENFTPIAVRSCRLRNIFRRGCSTTN